MHHLTCAVHIHTQTITLVMVVQQASARVLLPQQESVYSGTELNVSCPLLVLPQQHSRSSQPTLCGVTSTGTLVTLAQ
jgi:hypothetical protein